MNEKEGIKVTIIRTSIRGIIRNFEGPGGIEGLWEAPASAKIEVGVT